MTVTSKTLQWLVPALVVIGIGAGMVSGTWITESTKVPVSYRDGEFAGLANPADIRGSYSLQDVADAFGIPVQVLATAFGLPSDSANLLIKEFEDRFGDAGEWEIGTDAMRLFVARYLGRPYDPEPTTGLPTAAIDLVAAGNAVDAQTLAELRTRAVVIPAESGGDSSVEAAVVGADRPEESAGEVQDDYRVKGTTTFGELQLWNVPQEEIAAVLGDDIGPRHMSIRDFTSEKGISFSAVKEELQKLVDQYREND